MGSRVRLVYNANVDVVLLITCGKMLIKAAVFGLFIVVVVVVAISNCSSRL